MIRFVSFAALAAIAVTSAAAEAQTPPAQAQAPKQISKADYTKGVDARFANVDTNKDGFLNSAEVAAAQAKAIQQASAIEQQRLDAEFKKLDTDKNGALSFAEFKAAVPPLKAEETPAQMIAQIDSNKDGKISAAEYRAGPVSNFDKADTNHDGVLTEAEVAATRQR